MTERRIHPWFRNAFFIGSFLSLMAGIQLFVLSERTDVYFAWTIQSALTAATLGGFYLGSMTFGYISARESNWVNVRGPALGLFIFVLVSLAATILHLDKFHLGSENLLTRSAAWIWLAIYIFLPVGLGISYFFQVRLSNSVPEETLTSPPPVWYQGLLAVHGVAGVLLAIGLFFAPLSISPLWLWVLTPLTARALSAWFLSFGVLDLFSAMEKDWRRLRVTSIGYVVSGTFGIIALLRYSGQADLSGLAGAGYIAYLLLLLGFGLYGWKEDHYHG